MEIQLNCSYEVVIEIYRKLRQLHFIYLADYDFVKQQDTWLKTTHFLVIKNEAMLTKKVREFLFPYML